MSAPCPPMTIVDGHAPQWQDCDPAVGSTFRLPLRGQVPPLPPPSTIEPEHPPMANPSTSHATRPRVEAAPQTDDEASVTPQATEAEAHTIAPEPGTAAGELSGIVQAAGGDSVLAIGLALIAVVGGGAAFKLYTKLADQRHEREMAKLQPGDGGSDGQGAHAVSCDTERQQLGARVSALESDLKTLKRGLPEFPDDVDLEGLEARLRRAERAIKRISNPDN